MGNVTEGTKFFVYKLFLKIFYEKMIKYLILLTIFYKNYVKIFFIIIY